MLQHTNRTVKKVILKSHLEFSKVHIEYLAIQQVQLHAGKRITVFVMTNIYCSKVVEKSADFFELYCQQVRGLHSSESKVALEDIAKLIHPQMFAS